jgi:putative tryptophan/tyrosine transport system substrate-binding protein
MKLATDVRAGVLGFDPQVGEAILKRRDFIMLLGGAAAWPLAARAQQAAVPVVGHLQSGSLEPTMPAAFRKGLSETGYDEGRNVAIEYRWAEGQLDRLPAMAADLVRRRVAVIAAPGSTPAALAAKAATTTIPIVFSGAVDPVQTGLVASLNRPGGNVTGFSEIGAELGPKRLGIMHELMPGAIRFAMLVASNSQVDNPTVIANLQVAASAMGLQIEVFRASRTIGDIDIAIGNIVQKRVDAILVFANPLFYNLRTQVAALMARHAIPAVYWDRQEVEAGGLMSYGPSVLDLVRQVGVYTGRILMGEKPSDLPVQQPTKFELVINLKTAKALGLAVPLTLQYAADEVIE